MVEKDVERIGNGVKSMKHKEKRTIKHYQVGFVSITFYSNELNFGCLMHTYAFQQYLNRYNVSSVVIDYKTYRQFKNNWFKYPILRHLSEGTLYGVVGAIFHVIPHLIKYYKFQRFIKRNYIKTINSYERKDLLEGKLSRELIVDTWVCADDTIWNKYKDEEYDPVFFLNFPDTIGKRKVAYAPSINDVKLTEVEKIQFVKYTSDYFAISLRDKVMIERISALIHRPIEWMLDSSLLLDEADYELIIKKPHESKYVLLYIINNNDHHMIKTAIEYARKKSLKLIEISQFAGNYFRYRHTVKGSLGVEEWLGYIKYAECVFTNSFHGACFSILFEKLFWLFDIWQEDVRLRNLMEIFEIEDHLVSCDTEQQVLIEHPIDYENVDRLLEIYRERSRLFIEKNIIPHENL
jgi:hypothetical protein